jgi:hypothetical protein
MCSAPRVATSVLHFACILFPLVIVIACVYFAQAFITFSFVRNMQALVALIFLTSTIKLLRSAGGKKAADNWDDGDTQIFSFQNRSFTEIARFVSSDATERQSRIGRPSSVILHPRIPVNFAAI